MKIQINNSNSEVASTLSGVRVVKHTMSSGSINLQMLMLRTGLYSNKIQSVVREYLTNARDAHVDAGHSKPIDVVVPNRFGKDFCIRDYGAGMSPDFIESTYVQYTASTKRDSDSLTGGWGIGSKSGYAYTDSFTVVSIYNGVKYTWLAQSFPDGSGDFSLVSSVETDEHSGVEIQITMIDEYDSSSFGDAVNFFSSFIDMPVKINGSLIEEQDSHEVYSCEDFRLAFYNVVDSRYSKKIYIVQGGVPYPVDYSELENIFPENSILSSKIKQYDNYFSLCIFVPNGTFMPDISRENIQFDSSGETLSKIASYIKAAESDLASKFDSYIGDIDISNFDKYCISQRLKTLEGTNLVTGKISPFLLKLFKSKTRMFISNLSSRNTPVFDKTCFQNRQVHYSSYSPVTTTKDYNLDCRIAGALLSSDSIVTLLFLNSSYKRNLKVSAFLKKNDYEYDSSKNFWVVSSSEHSFEEYKNLILSTMDSEDSIFLGSNASQIEFFDISDIISRPRKKRNGKRRKTKFLKVDSFSGDYFSTSEIPEDEIKTHLKIVFALIYRNKLVDKNGVSNHSYETSRAIKSLMSKENISFRVIKLSDYNKNATLTRGKVDYSDMTYITDFESIERRYNNSFGALKAFEESVSEADSSCPEGLLSLIESCRGEIDVESVSEEMKLHGIVAGDMKVRPACASFVPDLSDFIESEKFNQIYSFFTQIYSYHGSEIKSNQNIVRLSKILPDMF
jgi:hypothetical protein